MVDRQISHNDDLGGQIFKRQRRALVRHEDKATRKSLGAALLRLAYDAGCRRLELVAIELRHVDVPDGEGARDAVPAPQQDRSGRRQGRYLSGQLPWWLTRRRAATRIERRCCSVVSSSILPGFHRCSQWHFEPALKKHAASAFHPRGSIALCERDCATSHIPRAIPEVIP